MLVQTLSSPAAAIRVATAPCGLRTRSESMLVSSKYANRPLTAPHLPTEEGRYPHRGTARPAAPSLITAPAADPCGPVPRSGGRPPCGESLPRLRARTLGGCAVPDCARCERVAHVVQIQSFLFSRTVTYAKAYAKNSTGSKMCLDRSGAVPSEFDLDLPETRNPQPATRNPDFKPRHPGIAPAISGISRRLPKSPPRPAL